MRRFGPLQSRERSTGHLKHFNSKCSRAQSCNSSRAAARAPITHCQQCIRAIPSNRRTILVPRLTPVALAHNPNLCRNFMMIMNKVRIGQSHALLRKNSMSRTGHRMALNSTRPLSLPSAGAFPLPVHLKLGELLITIRIPMVSIAILHQWFW